MKYRCPVCAWDNDVPCDHYNICPCCGTEFEGLNRPLYGCPVEQIRKAWLETGPVFWHVTEQPEGWTGDAQVAKLFSEKEPA